MFTTYEDFRAPLSRMWGDTDEKFWSAVKLTWNRIWFIATFMKCVQMGGEQFEVAETLLLGEKAQLDELANAVDRIAAVYIVTPAHLNGGQGWEIELLSKIRLAQEPNLLPQPVHMYETASGRRYTDSMFGTPWEKLLPKGPEMNFDCNSI